MAPRKKPDSGDGTEEGLLEQYSALIDQVAQNPYDRQLHLEHIRLTKELKDQTGLESARDMMATYHPMSDELWTEWIQDRKSHLEHNGDMSKHIELLELFKRANDDHLSIPLLLNYAQFVIEQYYTASGLSAPPAVDDDADGDSAMQVERKVSEGDPVLAAVFSLEQVREVRDETLAIGGGHLAESSKLFDVWKQFELDLLQMDKTSEQIAVVDKLFLERLAVPHIGMENTFSDYSRFVTLHDNDSYSTRLPAANKRYAPALALLAEREVKEVELKRQGYSPEVYIEYAAWERAVKRPALQLVVNLYNRAVAQYPEDVAVWDAYLEFCSTTLPKKMYSTWIKAAERAVTCCPGKGDLWAAYMRCIEKLGADAPEETDIETLFARAIGTKLFDHKNATDELVILIEARASYHRREVDTSLPPGSELDNSEIIDVVVHVLREGIERIRAAKKGGDPQMRLEKYLIGLLERFGRLDEAAAIWDDLTQLKPHNYAVWYGQADFETRRNNFTAAHNIYTQGCSQRGLDYPEYLLEAWSTFERQHGTLADLEFASMKIKRQRRGLEKKRAREMEAALQAQMQAQTQAQNADNFIAQAVSGRGASGGPPNDKKRAAEGQAEETGAGQASKKARTEQSVPTTAETSSAGATAMLPPPAPVHGDEGPKRDREHSTVFAVAPVEANVTEDDLRKLFKDCGEFREFKTKSLGDKTYAMIEFMDKDNVLAAQTKDKKRINDHEIDVSIAWQSCLYVTNFPESYDKEAVEKLFSQHGTIFDTRWPSKRYKSTRRFCYIQFASPTEAQAALTLHGKELEGKRLSVFISDPDRKKNRTDAGANNRELYVANLARSTKEHDLRKLFEAHGTLKGVRVPLDDKNECKGFAFIEYDDEASAQAALALNNFELKKRHISVTIAQPRARGTHPNAFDGPKEPKSAIVERSLRVRGIPVGTEEAIVQQAIEKHGQVKLVLLEPGSTEAIVEMENPAEAGKVLMHKDSITIDGAEVEIMTAGAQARTAQGKKPDAAKRSGGGDIPMLPRQAQRGRGKLGLGLRGRGGIGRGGIGSGTTGRTASTTAAGTTGAPESGVGGSTSAKSQDDFRAMLLGAGTKK